MRKPLILVTMVLALVGLPVPVLAVERNVSDVVLVDTGTVITDDLYAAGNRVVVHGRVAGDLIASAFEDVTITGSVTGDVIALSPTTTISGRVGGSVRIVGGSVTVDGEVGGDIVTVSWEMALGGEADGDLLVWAREGAVGGAVGGNVEGQMRRMTLGGSVAGNVDITVGSLTVTDRAAVGGDLGYRSVRPSAEIETGGVAGAVVHRTPLPPNVRVRAMLLLSKLVLSLSAGVAGLVVMWAAPVASAGAVSRIRASWGRAWLRGAGISVVPLAVTAGAAALVGLVPLEAAAPVFVAMVPVVLALFGMVGALALVAPAAVYPCLGDPRAGRRAPVRAYLLGLVAVTAAVLVPWLSWVVAAVVIPIGIGGWLGGAAAESAA